MAKQSFTKADIESAVEKTMTMLVRKDREALAQKVYDAHKGKTGVDLLAAFQSAISGSPPPLDLQAAFEAAAEEARTQRLAANAAKRTGGTPPPDPAVTKKAALEKAAQEAGAARNAAKSSADKANDDAFAAETDAEAAEKASSPEARLAANASRQAATEARTAADGAATQFARADAAQRAAEDVARSDGNEADANTAVQNAIAAQKAAERLAEQAGDHAKRSRRARERAERIDRDAEKTAETKKEKSFRNRWFKPRITAFAVLGAAVVALSVALFFGAPGWAVTGAVIGGIIVIAFVSFAPPASGLRAALGLMVLMLLMAGLAFASRDSGGEQPSGGINVTIEEKLPGDLTPEPTLAP